MSWPYPAVSSDFIPVEEGDLILFLAGVCARVHVTIKKEELGVVKEEEKRRRRLW